MQRISEFENSKFINDFQKLWLLFFIPAVLISSFHFLVVLLGLGGYIWLVYSASKLKEVHFNEDSIFIKNGSQYKEIPINQIYFPVEKSVLLAGAYTINFKQPTMFGKYIVFNPRAKLLFFKHTALKQFFNHVNT